MIKGELLKHMGQIYSEVKGEKEKKNLQFNF